MGKIFFLSVVLLCSTVTSQNLINDISWVVGTGSVTGFSQNGSTSENSRIWGTNHLGESVVLWEATPDATSGADGGWNSSYYSVDYTKAYRYSVWIKKTNSTSGSTYFGCDEPSDKILRLDGTTNSNPYFWSGDLPRLNRWYFWLDLFMKAAMIALQIVAQFTMVSQDKKFSQLRIIK